MSATWIVPADAPGGELIHAMGPRNTNKKNFKKADEWTQVKLDEREKYLEMIR